MFKLGISGQALGQQLSFEETVKFISDLRVSFIEVWPINIPLKAKSHIAENTKYGKRDLVAFRKTLKKYGVKAGCVTNAIWPGFKKDPLLYKKSLLSSLETADILEAGIVNTYFGGSHNDIKEFIEIIQPALKLAKKYKIIIVLENEAHDATGNADGMLDILEAVNSCWFKTNYDPCNYYHGNEEGFPYAYEKLKPYIKYIHIKGGCKFNKNMHSHDIKGMEFREPNDNISIGYVPICEGAVNFDGLFKRLEKDRYDGACTLEPHVQNDKLFEYLKKEVSWIKNRRK